MHKKNIKLHSGLPRIGTNIDGRYELIDLLGRGGFGAVYLAKQISMDRDVALKILLTQALNMDEMAHRFHREVMAIRNLSHPNTIQIYDFNKSEAGFLYYAMEAVKGPTLKQVIKDDGPLSPHRVSHITKQILKSLSEAHSTRIVHRDLKPANIMLAEMHGEVDFVKVLDFGIAKLMDAEDDEEHLTNAGVLIGTISYMSPEQISSRNIGPTTDIYALGLIGVEMLSGISVFAKSGKWEILNKQISSEPIDVPDFVANDPIGRVFIKAISKDPLLRFQNAVEMIDALNAIANPSKNTLVSKGWSKSEVKKGVKVSSISQSGPISVASSSGLMNTPSQPVAISQESLEAIPILDEKDIIWEPSVSEQFYSEGSIDDKTEVSEIGAVLFEKSSSKNKLLIPFIVFGVIALISVVGIIIWASSGEEEIPSTKEIVKNENTIEDQMPAKTVVLKEKRAEETIPDNLNKILVVGPEGASIYTLDKVRLGLLPRQVSIKEKTAFIVSADGFMPKEIELTKNSVETFVVELSKSKKAKTPKIAKKQIRKHTNTKSPKVKRDSQDSTPKSESKKKVEAKKPPKIKVKPKEKTKDTLIRPSSKKPKLKVF